MMTNPEIDAVKALMHDYKTTWAVCGGWSIDLFLGKKTREHKDIDLFIWRDEQLYAQRYFVERGWTLQIAHVGSPTLMDWKDGEYLNLPYHTIWCKREGEELAFIELLMNERNEQEFQFRRDKSIVLPLEKTLRYADGIPYLSPEIALLYKSSQPENEGNRADFEACKSHLSEAQSKWLLGNVAKLYGEEHLWLRG